MKNLFLEIDAEAFELLLHCNQVEIIPLPFPFIIKYVYILITRCWLSVLSVFFLIFD